MVESIMAAAGVKLGASPYRLGRKLGETALADIYLGEEMHSNRPVRIKALKPEALARNPELADRLRLDCAALRSLSHAHLAPVLDHSEFDGRPFLVTGVAECDSLWQRMTDRPPDGSVDMMAQELFNWLPRIASALEYLHGQNVLHGEVQPWNILFDRDGRPMLAEPGLTRPQFDAERQAFVPSTVPPPGSLRFVAPELFNRQLVDDRSDQFSLAMVVWEWLTGRRLLTGTTVPEIRQQHDTLEDLPAWLPEVWMQVFRKALAPRPEQRFRTCQEFAIGLLARIHSSGEAVRSPSRTGKPWWRSWMVRAACLVLIVGASAAAGRLLIPGTGDSGRLTELEAEKETLRARLGEAEEKSKETAAARELAVRDAAFLRSDLTLAQKRIADADRAHKDFKGWVLFKNDSDRVIKFDTRGRDWDGRWTDWIEHRLEPGKQQRVYFHGHIGAEIRYDWLVGDPFEWKHYTLVTESRLAADPDPTEEACDCRYQFTIRDGRIELILLLTMPKL